MDKIKITVRILPAGKEVMLAVPPNTLGSELITAILNKPDLNLDRKNSDGVLLQYELVCKETGREVGVNSTLLEAGVRDSYTIVMSPKQFVAG